MKSKKKSPRRNHSGGKTGRADPRDQRRKAKRVSMTDLRTLVEIRLPRRGHCSTAAASSHRPRTAPSMRQLASGITRHELGVSARVTVLTARNSPSPLPRIHC